MMKQAERLAEQIRPTKYRLELDVDLAGGAFSGRETIEFELTQAARTLKFHAVGLDISSAVCGERTANIGFNEPEQVVSFKFEQALPAGHHSLELEYSAQLSDKLHGFYRSTYKDGEQTKSLATTQFEPVSAREALVCVDEPAAKAIFQVSITAAKDLVVLSNTGSTATPKGDRIRFDFAPTPKMSTYLLAFIVGQFDFVEAKTKQGVRVRVYTAPGKQRLAAYALDAAVKTLEFYDDYFGTPYPLDKLDMVAIPDFAAGAMENWGLVTYRETAVLIDPDNSALANKQYVAQVVAHELGHQWFGNLVTMQWWTDLWLNEGFASWTESLVNDHLHPEWKMWEQFVSADYTNARQLDALANTHPIEVPINHPDEIESIFDQISYDKGSSIIRMLENYIGSDVFRRGLSAYLKKHSFSNTVTEDLWQALEEASGKPIRKVMDAWTKQPGHPLVSFKKSGQNLKLSQERFFASPLESTRGKTLWPIPISGVTSDGTIDGPLLETDTVQWELPAGNRLKPNPGQSGFYVVGYDENSLETLLPVLEQLSPIDQYGILYDCLVLARAGRLSTDHVLKLCQRLCQKPDMLVWDGILAAAGEILNMISDEALLERAEDFFGRLLEPQLERLGWEPKPGENYFDQLLRPLILGTAARCRVQSVVAEARRRWQRHLSGQQIPADLRGAVYSAVARTGDANDWEALWQLHQASDLQEEQSRLRRGLTLFKQPELHSRTLELSLSDDIRPQDTPLLIVALLGNRHARADTWQFIQDQWPTLLERYSGGGHMLTHFPRGLGMAMNTNAEVAAVQEFFDSHEAPGLDRVVKQAVEQIRLKAAWFERDRQNIVKILSGD